MPSLEGILHAPAGGPPWRVATGVSRGAGSGAAAVPIARAPAGPASRSYRVVAGRQRLGKPPTGPQAEEPDAYTGASGVELAARRSSNVLEPRQRALQRGGPG